MNTGRRNVKTICSLLSPLVREGTIPASRAGEISKAYISGDTAPLVALTEDPEIPVRCLPLVEALKKEAQQL